MFSETLFLDEIDKQDIINFITTSLVEENTDIVKVVLRFTTEINDEKKSKYSIEHIYELTYFLDDYQIVARCHLVPRKGGVIEEDNGVYYNDKSFFTLSDKEDMEDLKDIMMFYIDNTLRIIQLLSSNNIIITLSQYTMDDISKEIEEENKNV